MEIAIILLLACVIFAILFFKKKSSLQKENKQEKQEVNKKIDTTMETSEKTEKTENENSENNAEMALKEFNFSELPEKLQESYSIAIQPLEQKTPVLFALVTCHHCIRTQKFLKTNTIDFKVIHVDLFDGVARQNIMTILKTFNPKGSFPTLVMPTGQTIVGYKESQIKEAIQNG